MGHRHSKRLRNQPPQANYDAHLSELPFGSDHYLSYQQLGPQQSHGKQVNEYEDPTLTMNKHHRRLLVRKQPQAAHWGRSIDAHLEHADLQQPTADYPPIEYQFQQQDYDEPTSYATGALDGEMAFACPMDQRLQQAPGAGASSQTLRARQRSRHYQDPSALPSDRLSSQLQVIGNLKRQQQAQLVADSMLSLASDPRHNSSDETLSQPLNDYIYAGFNGLAYNSALGPAPRSCRGDQCAATRQAASGCNCTARGGQYVERCTNNHLYCGGLDEGYDEATECDASALVLGLERQRNSHSRRHNNNRPDQTSSATGNAKLRRRRVAKNSRQFQQTHTRDDPLPEKLTTSQIVMSSPNLQRGLAFNEQQRRQLNLLGLLPAAHQSQELQVRAVIDFLDNCCPDELSRYVYLRQLKDFNEHLFYDALTKNVEKLMPIVYTPTVGLACQKFSQIYMRPRGLFISISHLDQVSSLLANWPEKNVRVIVLTDGERILGLGDLGANGMGISIGKLSLYTALAGIPPKNVLPVTIDVGTNNEKLLEDPFYIGLRQRRVRGQQYEQLVEEFMKAAVERWGRSCLIQFEDFANSTAFHLLQKYRNDFCTFNDDIQGTASVCLSGLFSASKLTGKRLGDCSFLFYGAGEANLGTANLLIMAMQEEGVPKEEAKRRIWLVDSKGLVVKSRSDLSEHKLHFAQSAPETKSLEAIIELTKPTAIIGASAQGGVFNESVCKKMASINQRPIIFALSNPTSKAECTAKEAYEWTEGRCVFASGSPFEPVEYKGKTYVTGQGNNAYIFPGVGLAAIAAHTHSVPEECFLVAARALSDQVTEADTELGLIYPRLNKIRQVTLQVANRVLEFLYAERLATYRPEPSDKIQFLKDLQYDTSYEPLG